MKSGLLPAQTLQSSMMIVFTGASSMASRQLHHRHHNTPQTTHFSLPSGPPLFFALPHQALGSPLHLATPTPLYSLRLACRLAFVTSVK